MKLGSAAASSQSMAAAHVKSYEIQGARLPEFYEVQGARLPAFEEGKELMPPANYESWRAYNEHLGGLDINLKFGTFKRWKYDEDKEAYVRVFVSAIEEAWENYIPCAEMCEHPACIEHRGCGKALACMCHPNKLTVLRTAADFLLHEEGTPSGLRNKRNGNDWSNREHELVSILVTPDMEPLDELAA